MFLQEFGEHPNIIKLHNVIKAENDKDIYLVFEFMGRCIVNIYSNIHYFCSVSIYIEQPTCNLSFMTLKVQSCMFYLSQTRVFKVVCEV